jgi:glycine cleavage system H protein
MNIPDDLLYTKDHEWIRIVDDVATIGVTDYAQGELGDIIFIEFPDKGIKYQSGDPVGTIEAVKTVADIYAPIDGQILDVNVELEDEPDMINKDPYEKGWIIKLCKISKDVSDLLKASDYKGLIQ